MKNIKKLLNSSDGITLVETMIAFVLGAVVLLGTMRSLGVSMKSSVNSREQIKAGRLAQTVQSRLMNMPFDDIQALPTPVGLPDHSPLNTIFCDSSLPDFGIPDFGNYKSSSTLIAIQNEVLVAGFTRLTVDVTYLRRDSSDKDAVTDVVQSVPLEVVQVTPGLNGKTTYADQFDPTLVMVDWDANGNLFGTYVDPATNQTRLEAPESHLKRITIKLYKRDKKLIEQQQIMSKEKFSGNSSASVENPLKFIITYPVAYEFLAEFDNPTINASDPDFQKHSHDLALKNPYANWVSTFAVSRSISPDDYRLRFIGDTEPDATVEMWIDGPWSAPPNGPPTDVTVSGPDGHFDFRSDFVTDKLLFRTKGNDPSGPYRGEGWRDMTFRVTKNGISSPYHYTSFFLDINPPHFDTLSPAPATVVSTLCPPVYAVLADTVAATDGTGEASGLVKSVNYMSYKINNGPTTTSWVSWDAPKDKQHATMWMQENTKYLPPFFGPGPLYNALLRDGDQVTIHAEGGDQATYKTTTTWTFTINIDPNDATWPVIQPAYFNPGNGGEIQCVVSDPESGVNPYTITVVDEGASNKVLLDKSMKIGLFYNYETGLVHVPNTIPSGSTHRIRVTASNFNTSVNVATTTWTNVHVP